MWTIIARIILQNRILLLGIVAASTLFMAYQASRIELSYEQARILPADDPAQLAYQRFKRQFGQDGSVMVIGWQGDNLFQLDTFNGWHDLTNDIRSLEGIQDVLSIANLYNVIRNDSLSACLAPADSKQSRPHPRHLPPGHCGERSEAHPGEPHQRHNPVVVRRHRRFAVQCGP